MEKSDKSKIVYLRNDLDILVKYSEDSPLNCEVFNPKSNSFVTSPNSKAANISRARDFSEKITEEEWERITSNAEK